MSLIVIVGVATLLFDKSVRGGVLALIGLSVVAGLALGLLDAIIRFLSSSCA